MTSISGALSQRFPAYTGFAAVLSGAGLPIYIYAPKHYADTYGVSLTALGAVLFGLRFFDVVQDPILGWVAERLRRGKAFAVAAGGILLSVSMIGLFAVPPPIDPLWWFGLMITGLFSAFSFLTISFYAQGIAKVGDRMGGHVQLAAWREAGALTGICLAAIAPTALMGFTDEPFAAFAWGFAAATLLAVLLMWREWTPVSVEHPPTPIGVILSDRTTRRLLFLALVNATPLAVSSTLFLFYVESKLNASGWEGPLLVLFFLAAALSSPLWSAMAQKFGEKPVLLCAMLLAVVAFGWTLTLGVGDITAFAIICVLSGATIGADLTLLPAMFAKRMAKIAPNGGQGFGLWSLVNKFTLAFAAVLLLPLLEGVGFQAGTDNPQAALTLLTLLYALVPSVLKVIAIILLSFTKLEN
ncbi:MAG: GPH family glycoside/pentoside/hexuronide:cation symporter [Alteromonas macleodii]|jgi:GPH family glycoside/pentoside/hexuronide:cation symporter